MHWFTVVYLKGRVQQKLTMRWIKSRNVKEAVRKILRYHRTFGGGYVFKGRKIAV